MQREGETLEKWTGLNFERERTPSLLTRMRDISCRGTSALEATSPESIFLEDSEFKTM